MATHHLVKSGLPAEALDTLKVLGGQIRQARVSRNWRQKDLADRCFTSAPTIGKLEKGDPGVSMGIVAAVLHSLGLLDQLRNVADPALDNVGQQLRAAGLPKSVHKPRTNETELDF